MHCVAAVSDERLRCLAMLRVAALHEFLAAGLAGQRGVVLVVIGRQGLARGAPLLII